MDIRNYTNEEKEQIGRIYRTKLRKYTSIQEWMKEQLWQEAEREFRQIQEINKKGSTGYAD